MSGMLQKFGSVVARIVALSTSGPKRYARLATAASLSVAQYLLQVSKSQLVPDVRRLKETFIEAAEADTEAKKARSMKALAEATEASNNATIHKRDDAIALAKQREALAIAAKAEAEVEKIKMESQAAMMDAQTRRGQAIADAQVKFVDALSRLKQEGGQFFVNQDNLENILRLGFRDPQADDDVDGKSASS